MLLLSTRRDAVEASTTALAALALGLPVFDAHEELLELLELCDDDLDHDRVQEHFRRTLPRSNVLPSTVYTSNFGTGGGSSVEVGISVAAAL